jgi:hypothetical protein
MTIAHAVDHPDVPETHGVVRSSANLLSALYEPFCPKDSVVKSHTRVTQIIDVCHFHSNSLGKSRRMGPTSSCQSSVLCHDSRSYSEIESYADGAAGAG